MQRVNVNLLDIPARESLHMQGSLGETLRYERQKRGVTLNEIHRVTKIKIENLTALEEGRHDLLPAPIFVRGFIKAICQYLELPAHKLLPLYDQEGPRPPARVMVNPVLVQREGLWTRLWMWIKRLFGR